MPNQPKPDSTSLGIRLPRILKRRLSRLAAQKRISLSELINEILTLATLDIELTPEDYEEIARETRKARNAN